MDVHILNERVYYLKVQWKTVPPVKVSLSLSRVQKTWHREKHKLWISEEDKQKRGTTQTGTLASLLRIKVGRQCCGEFTGSKSL